MPKIEVKVNPDVLEYYIRNSEYTVHSLKEYNDLRNLEQWLEGKKKPTYNQLDFLSSKLRIPVTYLIISRPHKEEIPLLSYRTIDSLETEKTSRELVDTIKTIQRRQEFVSSYLKESGSDPTDFVGIFDLDTPIDKVMEYARKILNLPQVWQEQIGKVHPLVYFREKLSRIGILIFFNGIVNSNTHRKLDINEFRAFVLIDKYAPTIFINTNDSKNGQLFSLIHEFAHILYGENELYNVPDSSSGHVSELEKKCNHFASEILVANEAFIEQFKSSSDPLSEKVINLAQHFKVSKTVIARRALQNGFITQNDYYYFAELNKQEFLESKKRDKNKSGGDYWNNYHYKMDSTLFRTALNSYYEGKSQFTETLAILGVNRKGFQHLENNSREKGER